MFARMALLEHLALQPRDEHPAPVEIGTKPICRNPRCITQMEHYLPPLIKKDRRRGLLRLLRRSPGVRF